MLLQASLERFKHRSRATGETNLFGICIANLVDGCQLSLDEGAVEEVGELKDFHGSRPVGVSSPYADEGSEKHFSEHGGSRISCDLRYRIALVEPPAVRRLGIEIESGDLKMVFRKHFLKREVPLLLCIFQPVVEATPEVQI